MKHHIVSCAEHDAYARITYSYTWVDMNILSHYQFLIAYIMLC